jgi:flap endonuclease-1
LKSLHGRKIAIDASMAIYQFMIAVRSGGPNQTATMLTNADGETTSHVQGMFNRTIRFLSEGLKPAFVFDGKPPNIKSGELQKRRDKRQKAQEELSKATEEGNVEEQDKQSKRLVRAGHKENQDCQKLLRLMGVPVVVAPCEAEAQASALAKAGLVYAVGTEDMDALTFQTPVLVRKMTFANQSKSTVQTMHYDRALEGLGLNHEEFVDLCILMGCDYCDTIRGVGPKTALKLIREHKNIETILKNLDGKKYVVPSDWQPGKKAQEEEEEEVHTDKEDDGDGDGDDDVKKEGGDDDVKKEGGDGDVKKEGGDDDVKKEGHDDVKKEDDGDVKKEEDGDKEEPTQQPIPAYVQARKLFHHHEVSTDVELKWKPCQKEELTKFLVDEMGFSPERVKSNIQKLETAYKANLKPQSRMDSFFQVKADPNAAAKRKKRLEEQKVANKKQKKASGTGRKRR